LVESALFSSRPEGPTDTLGTHPLDTKRSIRLSARQVRLWNLSVTGVRPRYFNGSAATHLLEPEAKLRRVLLVAPEAQRPDIGKVAFSASFCDGDDVIGIPEAPSLRMEIQLPSESSPFPHRNQLEPAVELNRVQSADGADSAIPPQHLVSQVRWIGSQPPLVNTVLTAERSPALRYLGFAPAADPSAVRTAFPRFPNPAAGFFSDSAHYFSGGAIFR
jgi:hypothetical protein